MPGHDVEEASTTEGLPVAPSFGPGLATVNAPHTVTAIDGRVVFICAIASVLGVMAGFVAQLLGHLIALITNLTWFGVWSFDLRSPAGHDRGLWTLVIPVTGAIIIGLMARYGSRAIRGHGIPEAMEQVLLNRSRIPARVTFLKPLSAAISIGTGGPFGAEGPIIATGGSLGSLLGQWIRVTDEERKTLLAAGAAGGMAATFGSPVSAVLLAIELLLFEYRARSVIPVALAASLAAAVRWTFEGIEPVFAMPEVIPPGFGALWIYIAIGALIGVLSVGVTRAVYLIEDGFEKLPIHWMWWPAIGAVAVGAAGWFEPRVLGVGYANIVDILSGNLPLAALATIVLLKFIAWAIYLGSGTSGGTLAPLFTFGGGLGYALGLALALLLPAAGIDPRVAALVGMAAMFAGASRAFLASVVFAFETTRQPMGLLPLLGGCAGAYLISVIFMRHTIMTEKIARRGVRVPEELSADFFETVRVEACMTRSPVTLRADTTVAEARAWLADGGPDTIHQGYPLVEDDGCVVGVVTQRDLFERGADGEQPLRDLVRGPPALLHPDHTLRQAADLMVERGTGRLPVVAPGTRGPVLGIVTRSDLLAAHRRRLQEQRIPAPPLSWRGPPEAGAGDGRAP